MEAINRSPLKEIQIRTISPKKPKLAPLNETPILKFAKLSENARAPSRGSKLAAGYDLYRFAELLTMPFP